MALQQQAITGSISKLLHVLSGLLTLPKSVENLCACPVAVDDGARALLLQLQMMEGRVIYHKEQAQKYKGLYETVKEMLSEDTVLERKNDALKYDNQVLQDENNKLELVNQELKQDKDTLQHENDELKGKVFKLEQELFEHSELKRQHDSLREGDGDVKRKIGEYEQALQENQVCLEKEQAARREAEGKLRLEQARVQELENKVQELEASHGKMAASAAPVCTITVQVSCKSEVCGRNENRQEDLGAKMRKTQVEDLDVSIKKGKKTTAPTRTELEVELAKLESDYMFWKSGGKVDTAVAPVCNITTQDCYQAEGGDTADLTKRLQRVKKDNMRMKVQLLDLKDKIAGLTQENNSLKEENAVWQQDMGILLQAIYDYERNNQCLQQENTSLKLDIAEHKELLGEAQVFLDDAAAQVLALQVQVAATQAQASFFTKGWGQGQEEASLTEAWVGSVCSSNGGNLADCQESLSESSSTWSLSSSPAQPSTPDASRRSSLAGCKAHASPNLVVKAAGSSGSVRSRIPSAPGSVLEAGAGARATEAGCIDGKAGFELKATVIAKQRATHTAGKANLASAAKVVSTPGSVSGAAATCKGIGRQSAVGGKPCNGSSSGSRAQGVKARPTGSWRR